ncbi:hypothetical protein R1flu_021833 [Riccia fluitans]|uniref:Fibronectin type III-like domain-containing protein n=1 Tax=Riccia fluitans TaxID=41844 RepID=A0ABD1ZS44_9MARC
MASAMETLSRAMFVAVIVFVATTSSVSASAQEAALAEAPRSKVPYPCLDHQAEAYPFCDKRLPTEQRVRDLVSRLSLEEKEKLLVNKNSEIKNLEFPASEWWGEGLHGVAYSPSVHFGTGPVKRATSFPRPILTAASFNKILFKKIAQVISTEARAMHNENQAGLTYWSPNINIFRDPRWGRGQETPGEDPYLTTIYAEYFVRGMQEDEDYEGRNPSEKSSGKGPEKLKVSACCKHFTAYDIDQWYKVDRYDFDAQVTKQDLLDIYNPPFQSCVEKGKASSLMCSYNRVNSVPTCADYNFLTKLVRDTWGFDGYIVSGCDAVGVMYSNSKYAESPEQAVAYALKAGMDLNCGDTGSSYTVEAVRKGILNVSYVDTALHNSLTVLFRLGYFDGNPKDGPKYGKLDKNDVCTKEHQDLALEAAVQGIVLLKNDKDTLPLSPNKIRTLAVLGPNANDTILTMLGNYASRPCDYFTPYEALSSYVENAKYHPGCINRTSCDGEDWMDYIQSNHQEREAFDRISLRLPGKQEELVKTVSRVAKGPVILVLMNGGPLDIKFAKYDPKIKSILWVGYPGQAGGKALAQIIFGEHNPGSIPGRTYKFFTGEAIYKFGDGMSYTKFTHLFESAPTSLILSAKSKDFCSRLLEDGIPPPPKSDIYIASESDPSPLSQSMKIEIVVSVKNEGAVFGTSIILLYHAAPTAGWFGKPIKQLVGFERVDLHSMEEQKIVFKVDVCRELSVAGVDGTWSVPDEGVHTFSLGNSYPIVHEMKITYEQN